MPDNEIHSSAPDLSAGLKEDSSPSQVLDHVLGKDIDELIPWEPCYLPSNGVYYGGKIPNGKVEVRAMGIYADKILATQRLAQSGYALDYLFKKCVKFPDANFDPLDLIAGDRIFLLFYLRGITHGNVYEYAIKCTNDECKKISNFAYDLNNLARTIVHPSDETSKEPIKIILPYMSEAMKREFYVSIKLLRGSDTQAILKKQKFDKQVKAELGGVATTDYGESIDQSIEQNLNLIIVDVMGDKDKRKIEKFITMLHSKDTATIREFLRNKTPGIDTSIDVECQHCGERMRTELPITESFFRPSRRGGTGK